jgi:hypothetical protein
MGKSKAENKVLSSGRQLIELSGGDVRQALKDFREDREAQMLILLAHIHALTPNKKPIDDLLKLVSL